MKAETTLFRIRYKAVGEERTEFLDTRDFGWEQVRRGVTFRLETELTWRGIRLRPRRYRTLSLMSPQQHTIK